VSRETGEVATTTREMKGPLGSGLCADVDANLCQCALLAGCVFSNCVSVFLKTKYPAMRHFSDPTIRGLLRIQCQWENWHMGFGLSFPLTAARTVAFPISP